MTTDVPTAMDDRLLDWLLKTDPAIRWQVMRDLLDAPPAEVAAEHARVAHEGWGAQLLDAQWEDGSWDGGAFWPADFSEAKYHEEGQAWTATAHALHDLVELGVDAADPLVVAAVKKVDDGPRWEEGDQRFFDGEVEPCINGRLVTVGVYFGRDMTPVVERLLSERLPDGGWNCEAPHNSSVTSFDTTINVLEGLAAFAQVGDDAGHGAAVAEARLAAEEYLLERHLFRSLRTGEVPDEGFLALRHPARWRYDVLRGLDYLRASGREPDVRCAEALDWLRGKRLPDGRWPLETTPRGRVHFAMETPGEPSRWLTLRALRVLRWAEAGGL